MFSPSWLGWGAQRKRKRSSKLKSSSPSERCFSEPTLYFDDPGNHFVQFYESEHFLLDQVSDFVVMGLKKNEGVIVICRHARQHKLESMINSILLSSGTISNSTTTAVPSLVDEFKTSGQLRILEAEATLDSLMVNGSPNHSLFLEILVTAIDDTLERFPAVRAYGELVDICVSRGNIKEAMLLEGYWNRAVSSRNVCLLCSCETSAFGFNSQDSTDHHRICSEHSNVLISESSWTPSSKQYLRLMTELRDKTRQVELQKKEMERKLRCKELEVEKLTQELKSKNEELRKATEATNAKTAFLANVSHEIRTPLAAIVGYAELLLDSETEQTKREDSGIIIKNCRELTRIVNDVLDLAKVESGRLELENVNFSVNELSKDVCRLLDPVAKEKNIELKNCIVLPDGSSSDGNNNLDLIVSTDPTRLRQILVNIIGNALKFTNPNGSVSLTTSLEPKPTNKTTPSMHHRQVLKCVIEDTGIGISEAQATRLFQPFTQGDSSILRTHGGTGLGLFLSRQLAEKLGGELSLAESVPGKGSKFVLTIDSGDPSGRKTAVMMISPPSSPPIPVNPSILRTTPATAETSRSFDASPCAVRAGSASCSKKSSVSILVVDDNQMNRQLEVRVLERLGYGNITTATDGIRAVELAKEKSFDIILMDIQMPNLDGRAASRLIRGVRNDDDGEVAFSKLMVDEVDDDEARGRMEEKDNGDGNGNGEGRRKLPVIIALTAQAMTGEKEECLKSGMDDYLTKPIDLRAFAQRLDYWAVRSRSSSSSSSSS